MVTPNKARIRSFESAAAFETWLSKNHDREPELWLRLYKKDSGVASVSQPEALDVCLCWGWIDAIRKSFDAKSYLQRYVPRGARSTWSQVNREHIARLAAAGRMTEHGQRQVDLAKADGRWEAAYAPMRLATPETVPADLRAAIQANAKARKLFGQLNRMNLFALTFRVNSVKTPAGRVKKIASLVDMLARGETPVPLPAAKASRSK